MVSPTISELSESYHFVLPGSGMNWNGLDKIQDQTSHSISCLDPHAPTQANPIQQSETDL